LSHEKTLASGNVMRWEQERSPGRVGFVIRFFSKPSEEDLTEAMEVTASLVSPASSVAAVSLHCGAAATERAAAECDQFLRRGSRN
jgi:hypothetical protein